MLDSIAKLIESLAKLAWPVILVGLFVWLRPEIKTFAKNMQEAKLTVGDATLWAKAANDVAKAELARTEFAAGASNSVPTTSSVANTFLTASQSVDTAISSGNYFKGSNILWVDDDPSNNAFLQSAMQTLGASVTDALSTDEAMSKISSSQSYDLIISDMARIGNDQAGEELLKKLRQRGISTPLVIYSTTKDSVLIQQAKADGALAVTNSPNELMRIAGQALSSGVRAKR